MLQQDSPQRILAFGTWLPPEPALQMNRAVDALRESGESFRLNLTTANGNAIEAMGRAIGGQAIVRIRPLAGVKKDLAEANLRLKSVMEETEMLRGFAAASPWPLWAKGAKGKLIYANAAYAYATEAASVDDAISRIAEQSREARVGIEARQAQPVDGAVVGDERRGLGVTDERVLLDA